MGSSLILPPKSDTPKSDKKTDYDPKDPKAQLDVVGSGPPEAASILAQIRFKKCRRTETQRIYVRLNCGCFCFGKGGFYDLKKLTSYATSG